MNHSLLEPFGICIHLSSRQELEELFNQDLSSLLRTHKLVLLRGLSPFAKQEFLELALRLSPPGDRIEDRLLHWSFGPIMELKVDPKSENYLFSNEKVPFHWDGAFHREPQHLLFNCVEAPDPFSGGETLFCDMEKVLQSFSQDERRTLLQNTQLTYKTEQKAHYGGEVTLPIIRKHPNKDCETLSYAEPVHTTLNPVSLEVHGLEPKSALFLQSVLEQKLYSNEFCYVHQWEEGDILIADNFSTTHGRRAFLKETKRFIRRAQIL